MPETAPNRTWKQDQKKHFGARLKWAQMRAGYRKSSDLIRKLEIELENTGLVARTYYSHAKGERVPDEDRFIKAYCKILRVSREFLLFGFGPELNEYQNAREGGLQGLVNLENTEDMVNASHFEPIRYIPILRATSIKPFLTGTGDAATMASEHLPMARDIVAGSRTFGYSLPRNDRSMIGAGGTGFQPETSLCIDPDRAIMPGEFALVWPAGWPEPTLRQFKGKRPFLPKDPKYPFELHALNEDFDSIDVESAEDCEVFGRLILSSQKF